MAFHMTYQKPDTNTSGTCTFDTKDDLLEYLNTYCGNIWIKEIGIDGPAPMGQILITPKYASSWKDQDVDTYLTRLQTLFDTANDVINPKRS